MQLKNRFFSGLQDKMRDSMRFLYTQEDCTFSKLLKAAMIAEAESKPRVTAKVKAATADTNTNNSNQELSSIQSQLDSMSKILKSAQFNKNAKSKGKGGAKKGNNSKSAEAKPQHKSQGPAVSAAGPFTGGKPPIQCHRCMGWGHFMRNCPNREPIQGSVEWGNLHGEVALEGAPLPQAKEHPQNQQ